jgi:hypothetical protein
MADEKGKAEEIIRNRRRKGEKEGRQDGKMALGNEEEKGGPTSWPGGCVTGGNGVHPERRNPWDTSKQPPCGKSG